MDYRRKVSVGGHPEVWVTQWGMGTAAIGALYQPVETTLALAALQQAYESGVRYFDTAPLYGRGLAETRLGEALKAWPRNEVVLSTKVGYTLQPDGRVAHDYSADAIVRSVDESLQRLGTDYLDIAYIHDPDQHYQSALDEAYPVLQRLREQGVIRAIGIGMNQSAMLTRFAGQPIGTCFCWLAGIRYSISRP